MPGQADPRRPDRVQRYVPTKQAEGSSADHINAIGMVCSLLGLLIKVSLPSFKRIELVESYKLFVFLAEVGGVGRCLLFTDLHGQQQGS